MSLKLIQKPKIEFENEKRKILEILRTTKIEQYHGRYLVEITFEKIPVKIKHHIFFTKTIYYYKTRETKRMCALGTLAFILYGNPHAMEMLSSEHPFLRPNGCIDISRWNDRDKLTFSQIADRLEKEWFS